jgi:hypothetical protein
MGIGTFHSHNKVGETWSFQTVITSASTFNPFVTFLNSARVSWDIGEPYYFGGNNLSHVYPDNGDIKTVTIRTYYGGISDIYNLWMYQDNIYGHVNLSGFTNLGGQLRLDENPRINKITNPTSPNTMFYGVNGTVFEGSDVTGTVDLTTLTGITAFNSAHRPGVTQILNPISNLNISYYAVSNNGSYPYAVTGLTGTLDLSTLTGLGGYFNVQNNPLLTEIINPVSSNSFYYYNAVVCNLINLDLSTLTGLGGQILLNNNYSLSAITNPVTYENISFYTVSSCNITSNLDVSGFHNLGGSFRADQNINLTSVTHTYSPGVFLEYNLTNCDITGVHDLSMFPNLGGSFYMGGNNNLSAITHTASTKEFTSYIVNDTNLTGTHDLYMLSNLSGLIKIYNNSNLTKIIFPLLTGGTFANDYYFLPTPPYLYPNACLNFKSCDLGYIDFKFLSAATMSVNSSFGASVWIENNNLTSSEINNILVDFDWMSTVSPSKWSGVTLSILTGNSSPDTTSGGYDGIAAINSLTGSPKNWIIT